MRFRSILRIASCVNVETLLVEIAASRKAESTVLMTDAIDFPGNAIKSGISLVVLAAVAVWRSRRSLEKACAMGIFGAGLLWPDTGAAPLLGSLALAFQTCAGSVRMELEAHDDVAAWSGR